jgi:hypothetical protein
MQRLASTGVAGVCLAVLAGASYARVSAQAPAAPAGQGQNDAQAVMAAARDALGSEKRIAAVKTVVATGRTRQVQGDNLVPIEFEIDLELPDKYVRTDEIPARESGPTRRGFNGAALIQAPAAAPARGGSPAPAGGRPGAAAPDPTAPLKQDFARLTLGMFASSFDAYPLTFGYAGAAEAPEGKADVIDVKGPGVFSARLFINSQTHLPLMLSWTVPGPPAAGQPAKPTESRIYYADYRDVDGLKLPFRIRRAVSGNTVEETVFDRFRINAKIDPRKFEVRP